jgi:hypothetical protein
MMKSMITFATAHRCRIQWLVLLLGLIALLSMMAAVTAARAADAPPGVLVWRREIIAPGVAPDADMTLDGMGLPHVAYRNPEDYVYAHWSNNLWLTETITHATRPVPWMGGISSLALDREQRLHFIAVSCDIRFCGEEYVQRTETQWVVDQTLPGFGDLAVDANNEAHLLYTGNIGGPALLLAHKTITGWITTTVHSGSEPYQQARLELDQTDAPHISYVKGHHLVYASLAASGWVTQLVDTIEPHGLSVSLALDNQDQPHIAYSFIDEQTAYLKYAARTAQQWSIQIVATGAGDLLDPDLVSLALDSQGDPHLALTKHDELRYGRQLGASWLMYVVDRNEETLFGAYGSFRLALDDSDLPRISYTARHETGYRLKFAWGELPQSQVYLPLINQ